MIKHRITSQKCLSHIHKQDAFAHAANNYSQCNEQILNMEIALLVSLRQNSGTVCLTTLELLNRFRCLRSVWRHIYSQTLFNCSITFTYILLLALSCRRVTNTSIIIIIIINILALAHSCWQTVDCKQPVSSSGVAIHSPGWFEEWAF